MSGFDRQGFQRIKLSQWNYQQQMQATLNREWAGVDCDKCGVEMYYVHGGKNNVRCPQCSYTGIKL